MQISFLKDLVTLRNPCSPFTFLNYLHSQQRLIDFINRNTFTPSRLEFADYLSWAARQLVSHSSIPPASDQTETLARRLQNSIDLCYGERVLAVEGVRGPTGDIELLRVSSIKLATNCLQQYLCRNLIISAGGTARIPKPFHGLLYEPLKKSCHIIHTSTFLHHIDHILRNLIGIVTAYPNPRHLNRQPVSTSPSSRSHSSTSLISSPSSDGSTDLPFNDQLGSESHAKLKIAVIGAGQSAAETLLETYNRIKPSLAHLNHFNVSVQIDLIIKQGHLRPSDDSPFVNEVFNPKSTDFFYEMCAGGPPRNPRSPIPNKLSSFLLKEAATTNYAVVNPETLTELYEIIYAQKVEEGMGSDQLTSGHRCHDAKINIINFTEVIAAEEYPSGNGSVNVLLENILTGQQTRSHYHAMILGTGYVRQSWKELLFGKSTEYQGSGVHLGDLWPNLQNDSLNPRDCLVDLANTDSPTNSSISSQLSDEQDQGHDIFCRRGSSIQIPHDLKVSRNYQLLLPKTFVEPDPSRLSTEPAIVRKFRPTVWLQGCNESTHGISDTLLSVISVRSQEIYNAIKQGGWFGHSFKKDEA